MRKLLITLLLLTNTVQAEEQPIDWGLPVECAGTEVNTLVNDEFYWRRISEELITSCQAMYDGPIESVVDTLDFTTLEVRMCPKQESRLIRKLKKACGRKCRSIK